MNYANMIEEKNLKKTFIIATLCSTLVGTFTSSMGLYDRIQSKRSQKKRDIEQDVEIKKLRDQVESAEKRNKKDTSESRRRDDVGDTFQQSGALIQRQFDEGYGRLGSKFAVGDTITENQLQKQIIALQQTVINVLQDALYNDRQLTRADIAKLVAASNAAREGSLDALRQQQQRLALPEPPNLQRALPAPKRAPSVADSDTLFCRYSLNLQYIHKKRLAMSFAPGSDCRCPECGLRLDVTSEDFWQIGKRTPIPAINVHGAYEEQAMETREFHLGQRFVVKCHTADGEYACVLCSRYRDKDVICRTVEGLVNHVGRFHEVEELERDVDLKEVVLKTQPMLPAPMPPTREVKELEFREYR